jgi:hypothetical protein
MLRGDHALAVGAERGQVAHDDFRPVDRTACSHDADPHRGHNAANPTNPVRGHRQMHGPTRDAAARCSSDSVRMCSANTW